MRSSSLAVVLIAAGCVGCASNGHMLPAESFPNTWAHVTEPGTEQAVLGPYLPQGEYRAQSAFEQRGCPLTKQ